MPFYPSTAAAVRRSKNTQLVVVEVTMEHLRKYRRPVTQRLSYAATFTVTVGQTVLCPPTQLNQEWTKGTVIGPDRSDYAGPVKYIRPLGRKRTRKAEPAAQPAQQQQLPLTEATG